MRVLVCGGRDFDAGIVWHYLEHAAPAELGAPISMVIQGGASGADAGAAEWAERSRIPCRTFAANWRKYGKRAGPLRNQRMIDEGKPEAVIAFEGGRGTADMIARAEAAGIRVLKVGHVRNLLPAEDGEREDG